MGPVGASRTLPLASVAQPVAHSASTPLTSGPGAPSSTKRGDEPSASVVFCFCAQGQGPVYRWRKQMCRDFATGPCPAPFSCAPSRLNRSRRPCAPPHGSSLPRSVGGALVERWGVASRLLPARTLRSASLGAAVDDALPRPMFGGDAAGALRPCGRLHRSTGPLRQFHGWFRRPHGGPAAPIHGSADPMTPPTLQAAPSTP